MAGDLVLITGATGMIGFRILVLLLEAGYAVRAAVRNQDSFKRIAALPPILKYKSQVTSYIVPDITVHGAYKDAVKGVKYIIHVASPLPNISQATDYQESIIQPAIQGTVGILESAAKTTGISRVVITASVVSIASLATLSPDTVVDEQYRDIQTEGPFENSSLAYSASKALAYDATKTFIKENNPPFDVINIMPDFVIGRDDTVTEASNIIKGTNGLLMSPILGYARDRPIAGITVHVDDVAKLHVQSLNPKIKGNEDYIAAGPDNSSINWADSFEIVKKHYPEQYKAGVFKFDSISKPPTAAAKVSNAKAMKAFGITFKSFEEQVISVVDHFLELTGHQ